jgi:inosine/xanthosine triphosphate pyrophosphatase family protein/adenylate kinase family enzyme
MNELVFITSNNEKLAQARYLSRNYDITISKQKQYGVSYNEPRIKNKDELLNRSFEDAYSRWKKSVANADDKFFFIEDTSVIIEALSSPINDVPGTDIKYWMRENNFESLDTSLRSKDNNRKVSVRSDVLLFLPKTLQKTFDKKYIVFTGQVEGNICEREYTFKTQPFFPWLSNKTFNKWFIPNGCSKPLSLLPVQESEVFDFRAIALNKMLSFLEGVKFIKKINSNYSQPTLSIFTLPLIILCGPTCAGKTTLAEFLRDNYHFYHFEASDFMYKSYYDYHGINSEVKIADFAEAALKKQPCIVSDQIIIKINELKQLQIVITGFRDLNEIECLKTKLPSAYIADDFYIDANIEIRFERNKIRKRLDGAQDFLKFKTNDDQQYRMGLKGIERFLSNDIIKNEKTKNEYYEKFIQKCELSWEDLKSTNLKQDLVKSYMLEHQIILSLADYFYSEKFFTTTEIAKLISVKYNIPKNKNNVSRYFNFKFYPYYEIKFLEEKKKYKLSHTGFSHSIYLQRHFKLLSI